MSPQGEMITPTEWLADTSIGESARISRRFVLGPYASVNGRSTADEAIADIKAGTKTIVGSSRALVDSLRNESSQRQEGVA